MSRFKSPSDDRQKLEDLALEVARVALANGWPVLLCDRRLTRATRYHGLRFPDSEDWWWADELSEILDKVVAAGYSQLAVVGVERSNLVGTWGISLRPGLSKSQIEA